MVWAMNQNPCRLSATDAGLLVAPAHPFVGTHPGGVLLGRGASADRTDRGGGVAGLLRCRLGDGRRNLSNADGGTDGGGPARARPRPAHLAEEGPHPLFRLPLGAGLQELLVALELIGLRRAVRRARRLGLRLRLRGLLAWHPYLP